jgi:putative transposase
MPRIARVVAKGYPHHACGASLTCHSKRCNYRQPVFEEDDDYVQYIEWLKDYGKKYSLKIWAYCLMSNHVHFVCVPAKEDSLSRTFGKRDRSLA